LPGKVNRTEEEEEFIPDSDCRNHKVMAKSR